jgi:hypothetical protein
MYDRESNFPKSHIFKFQKIDLGGKNWLVAWIGLKMDRRVVEKAPAPGLEPGRAVQGPAAARRVGKIIILVKRRGWIRTL